MFHIVSLNVFRILKGTQAKQKINTDKLENALRKKSFVVVVKVLSYRKYKTTF